MPFSEIEIILPNQKKKTIFLHLLNEYLTNYGERLDLKMNTNAQENDMQFF